LHDALRGSVRRVSRWGQMMNANKGLHALNGILWIADAIVSFFYAHSAPLGVIGCLGTALAAVLIWLEP
jgi:hypothetical protein